VISGSADLAGLQVSADVSNEAALAPGVEVHGIVSYTYTVVCNNHLTDAYVFALLTAYIIRIPFGELSSARDHAYAPCSRCHRAKHAMLNGR
jgi:hypothetical protein